MKHGKQFLMKLHWLKIVICRIKKNSAGFIKLEDEQKQMIEMDKSVLGETIENYPEGGSIGDFYLTHLMEEVSLLIDAVSRIDEPFLMVIVVIMHPTPSNCGSRNMHWY